MEEMGMSTSSYWLSWLLYFTTINSLLSTMAWAVLLFGTLKYTGGMVFWLAIWLYGQSIFGFIMLCQSFFTEARTAAVVTTIVYFGSALTLQVREQAPIWQKVILCFSPCACMTQLIKAIIGFELNGVGITMDGLFKYYRNFNAAIAFSLFIISFIIMNLLGLYLDMVIPRTYGKSKPCCFCCSSKKQRKVRGEHHNKIDHLNTPNLRQNIDWKRLNKDFETKLLDEECYEGVTNNIAMQEAVQRILKITGLKKVYPNGMKAVNGINLKMYADQIFVMLGHNGAGKTSLISMLTGLYEPTEGEAECFGVNMFTNFEEVRQFLGICPQHDVLFELLTPREHLEIFYDFKGGDTDPVKKKAEIDKLIWDVGLFDQQDDLAGHLSGGYQRKLSVSQSLVGGSKLIILDEPTASLDLNARRYIWTMLKEYKKDRIILLTTHYMDEADILGDRIGVMSHGKLMALGSTLFLKKKFGGGYNLTLVKADDSRNTLVEPYFIKHLGAKSKKRTEVQTELTMQVPMEYVDNFQEFFAKFDEVKEEMGILSYGVSITTLEDVFLELGSLQDRKKALESAGNQSNGASEKTKASAPHNVQKESPSRITPFDVQSNEMNGSPRTVLSPNHQTIKTQMAESFVDSNQTPALASPREITSEVNQFNDSSKRISEIATAKKAYKSGKVGPYDGGELPTEEKHLQLDLIDDEDEEEASNYEKFSLANMQTDESQSFCTSFVAVLRKRVQIYQSQRKTLYELALPAAIMVIGTLLTSIDMFQRSPSRILLPTRVSNRLGAQQILFDKYIVNDDASNVPVSHFINAWPEKEYFNITEYPTRDVFESNEFSVFDDLLYWWGQTNVPEWPFFYAGYKIYEANTDKQRYMFYNWVNMTNQDSVGLYPQYMYESILKVANNNTDFTFKTRSTPYPVTNEVKNRKVQGNASAILFLTAVSYGMLMTSVVGQIVWERMSGIKHMQMISGMNRGAYWLANFIIDIIKVEIIVFISVIAFFFANLEYHTSWMTFLLWPIASIPMTYVMSFMFTSESGAQTGTIFLNFGTILFGSTLVFFLRFIKEWEPVGDWLNQVMKLLPAYTLGQSIYFDASMSDLVEYRDRTLGEGAALNIEWWRIENVKGDLISLVCHFVFWNLILIFIEVGLGTLVKEAQIGCMRATFPPIKEYQVDPDVAEEAARVNDPNHPEYKPDENMQIKVKDLRKVYIRGGFCGAGTPLVAVEKLSFGLQKGECFALLGVNGAGKSTCFKTLTAAEEPTDGSIKIQGLDITDDFQEARKLLGYCPQYNPIFEQLTVQQNIDYFASIKGIPPHIKDTLINKAVVQLGLTDHRDKHAGTLSGGNKRKLSVAIAIVGNPSIILLDEPSAGMDPEARRFMWDVVAKIQKSKTSAVILTSHLMEEAEALCTKMGIMVKGGRFKCMGSSQHIKNKFGRDKYEIEIKIDIPEHQALLEIANRELGGFFVEKHVDEVHMIDVEVQDQEEPEKKVYIGAALRHLKATGLEDIVLEKILMELVITFMQAAQPLSIKDLTEAFEQTDETGAPIPGSENCSAVIFAEKLFDARNLFGTIKAICKVWKPSQETLDHWEQMKLTSDDPPDDPRKIEMIEQYGNYMKLRISHQNKTIGQMFGMVNDLKTIFNIDQYSISQTSLEQIFQSFANLNFDRQVRTFSLSNDDNETLQVQ